MAKEKVDNFSKINSFLTFSSEDDFYYIIVMRRGKDNNYADEPYEQPFSDFFISDKYLKGFVIKSYDDVLEYKEEIISLCEENNARAYISINPRSFTECNESENFMTRAILPRRKEGDAEKYPRTLIDVDFSDAFGFQELSEVLEENSLIPIMETNSPNGGKQYVMGDRRVFDVDFSYFDKYERVGKVNNNNAAIHCLADTMVDIYANLK